MPPSSPIDLRSDTAIQPTAAMLESVRDLMFADDMLREDDATNALLQRACEILDAEDAVLTPSGTMSNQIAVITLTSPGDEVILGPESHVRNLEGAGLAANAGVQVRCVPVEQGVYDTDALERTVRHGTLQEAPTGLISLEASYDLNSGYLTPLDNFREVRRIASAHGIPVYLDGARLFNTAHALGVEPAEIVREVDAVQFCLNKGLGAPLGSLLLGSAPFIERARRVRQRLGGGMRHTGLLAAPGLLALQDWQQTIAADHEAAQWLAQRVSTVAGITVVNQPVQTNIVTLAIAESVLSTDAFVDDLAARGVLVKRVAADQVRLVMHRSAGPEDLERACAAIEDVLRPEGVVG